MVMKWTIHFEKPVPVEQVVLVGKGRPALLRFGLASKEVYGSVAVSSRTVKCLVCAVANV